MPDRRDNERELESELQDLGSRVEHPPTPDLAGAVRSRIEAEEGARPARPRIRRPLSPALRGAAAAAMLVLLVSVPALSPEMRGAVTGWFEAGGGGSAESGAGGAPESGGAAPDVETERQAPGAGLGERVTLREASAGAEPPLLLPEGAPGEPEAVYEAGSGDEVTLVYRARRGLPELSDTGIGLIITETSGDLETAYLDGELRPEAGRARVRVDDDIGYWIPAGEGSLAGRAGGNVLLWERGGRALRMEADLPKQESVRLADSLR